MSVDVSPKQPRPQTYLGDGVYASFDGYHIWVTTERENGTHKIALEPSTYAALEKLAQRVWGSE